MDNVHVTAQGHGLGWHPDLPDQRDFGVEHLMTLSRAPLPVAVNMRGMCPAVYDQGQLGSCTANAIAGAIEFDQVRQRQMTFVPSRLFIYYNERLKEGTVASDAGAMLRDGIKSVAKQGACPESEWPYNIARFAETPPQEAYLNGVNFRALRYARLKSTNIRQLKGVLAAGWPFVGGFTVYNSFESGTVAQDGIVPMPSQGEAVLGGHAVLVVGYDDSSQRFIVRNSWGDGWGQQGYCTMPYAYLTDPHLASDFWVIRQVKDTAP